MTETAAPPPLPARQAPPTRFGHPIGLVNLFGVELWDVHGARRVGGRPAHEATYFGVIGAVAVLVDAVVWVLAPRVSRLMAGAH